VVTSEDFPYGSFPRPRMASIFDRFNAFSASTVSPVIAFPTVSILCGTTSHRSAFYINTLGAYRAGIKYRHAHSADLALQYPAIPLCTGWYEHRRSQAHKPCPEQVGGRLNRRPAIPLTALVVVGPEGQTKSRRRSIVMCEQCTSPSSC
jgi:hypothetical protein